MPEEDERPGDASAESKALQGVPRDLYRAVYRPGASDQEVEALRHALSDAEGDRADRSSSSPPPRRRRSGRRALAGALLAGVVGLALVESHAQPFGGATAKPERSPGSPFAASVPVPLLGDVENRRRQEVALARLFDRPGAADLQVYLLDHHFSGAVDPLDRSDAVHGSAVGRHTFDLGSIAAPTTARLTVLLTCDRPAAFTWRLVSFGVEHDDPTSVRSDGPRCDGHVVKSTVRVPSGRAPTRLEVEVARDIRTIVTVVAVRTG